MVVSMGRRGKSFNSERLIVTEHPDPHGAISAWRFAKVADAATSQPGARGR